MMKEAKGKASEIISDAKMPGCVKYIFAFAVDLASVSLPIFVAVTVFELSKKGAEIRRTDGRSSVRASKSISRFELS